MNQFLKLCFIFIHLPTFAVCYDYVPLNSASSLFETDDNDLRIAAKYQNVKLPKSVGQVVGIGVSNDNKLIILHRADRTWNANSFNENNIFNSSLGPIKRSTLLVLELQTGKVIKEGGANQFYMPHGLSVDQYNNIWVTDVGLHQVFKLDSKLKVLLTLGEKLVPGSSGSRFCMPTDVAISKTGEIFVSDGYCNNRISKFDSSGKFIKSFGDSNEIYGVPTEDSLALPHSLTIDEQLNMLCVADRDNERILCYSLFGKSFDVNNVQLDTSGELVAKIENIGRVYAIRFKEHIIFGATVSSALNPTSYDVFAMDVLTKRLKVITDANGREWIPLFNPVSYNAGIENAHCIDVSNNGTIFVGQAGPNRVTEILMESEAEEHELPSYF